MLGHARPVYLGFRRGGKMVATAGGVSLALAPVAALTCAVIWIAVFALLRYASVASIVTALLLPFLCLAFGASWPIVGFAALAAAGVVLLHRQNIRRLLAGTEPRFERRRHGGAPA
jgi:glycerol-3-phosphate acyltransferase PlsY